VKQQVFCYGTLAIPHVMAALTGGDFRTISAHVTHYARFLLKDKPYPGMCRRDGVVTSGLLYLNVDAQSLRVIDGFEDDIYVREVIEVLPKSGVLTNAWAYIVSDKYTKWLGVECWDPIFFWTNMVNPISKCVRKCELNFFTASIEKYPDEFKCSIS